ncbi:conjugal transfer protein [Pseudoroseomonas rhizosphaerae]|uniref:Conjugal transfer protein n=1 Tax=Teichococcus rhizosphaerae TaxID=1335062 RepID=A0A2C7ABL6_9PROT|nr:LapA family protein [Pseudoroseomonas rhizosphaerae]PHK95043.1 conjugal transfer protein [Pseudoroseomonas rhizosphaerae]
MRILGFLLTALLLLVLVLFTISNTDPVSLQLWPFDLSWEVPLAGAVLGAAALFFLLGALVAWGGALRYRRRASRMQRAAQLLEAELAELRGQHEAGAGAAPGHAAAPPATTPSTAVATR